MTSLAIIFLNGFAIARAPARVGCTPYENKVIFAAGLNVCVLWPPPALCVYNAESKYFEVSYFHTKVACARSGSRMGLGDGVEAPVEITPLVAAQGILKCFAAIVLSPPLLPTVATCKCYHKAWGMGTPACILLTSTIK